MPSWQYYARSDIFCSVSRVPEPTSATPLSWCNHRNSDNPLPRYIYRFSLYIQVRCHDCMFSCHDAE